MRKNQGWWERKNVEHWIEVTLVDSVIIVVNAAIIVVVVVVEVVAVLFADAIIDFDAANVYFAGKCREV